MPHLAGGWGGGVDGLKTLTVTWMTCLLLNKIIRMSYTPLNEICEQIISKQWTLHYYRPATGSWHSIGLQPFSLNPMSTYIA